MDITTEENRIKTFVDKGNYHAAINITISAMNECRRIEDQVGIDKFIGLMRSIVNTIDKKFGKSD